jgi:hypothetical protein
VNRVVLKDLDADEANSMIHRIREALFDLTELKFWATAVEYDLESTFAIGVEILQRRNKATISSCATYNFPGLEFHSFYYCKSNSMFSAEMFVIEMEDELLALQLQLALS